LGQFWAIFSWPKFCPNHWAIFSWLKFCPNHLAIFSRKNFAIKNCPNGEILPNLVTLNLSQNLRQFTDSNVKLCQKSFMKLATGVDLVELHFFVTGSWEKIS
jgi:hypothetical protein